MKGLPFVVALVLLAGCQGKVPTVSKPPVFKPDVKGAGIVASGDVNIVTQPPSVQTGTLITNDGGSISGVVKVPAGLITNDGGSLITNDGGSLITNDGGSLITNDGGSLITNDGGSLITNDGGSLITNDGGSLAAPGPHGRRLLAAEAERPLRGAVVGVFDAAGKELRDAAGNPVRALTDAQGRFELPKAPSDHNVVVRLLNTKDGYKVGALVPKDGRRDLTLDVASTVTATYILNKFVKGLPDAAAAYDRLPAAETAKVVALATAALGDRAADASLIKGFHLDQVEALRGQSKALDDQLAAVQRIIGIGVGQRKIDPDPLANSFSAIRSLACGPDGTLYLGLLHDNTVVAIADGKAHALNDPTTATTGSLTGQHLPAVGLMGPLDVEADARGRLVVLDYPRTGVSQDQPPSFRLSRLADGVAEDLWPGIGLTLGAWPQAGDEVQVLTGADTGALAPAKLLSLAPGQAPRELHVFDPKDTVLGPNTVQNHYTGYKASGPPRSIGHDAAGNLYVGVSRPEMRRAGFKGDAAVDTVFRYEAGSYARRAYQTGANAGVESLVLAPTGDVIAIVSTPDARQVVRYTPDGRTLSLATLGDDRRDFVLDPMAPAAVAPDGTAYVVRHAGTVWRIANGQVEHVAGIDPTSASADTNLSFLQPAGITIKGADTFVSDKNNNRIYRVGPDGKVVTWAGTGSDKGSGDGGSASVAGVRLPRALRQDAAGNIYVLSSNTVVRKVDPSGRISTVLDAVEGDRTIRDLLVAPDGTFTLSLKAHEVDGGKTGVARWSPDGKLTWLVPESNAVGTTIGSDPTGTVYALTADGEHRSLVKIVGDKPEPIVDDPRLAVTFPDDSNAIAVDGRGRLFLTLVDSDQIWMVDLASRQLTQVAGEGAPLLAGTGLDDSLSGPRYPTFGPEGDLYLADIWHRQVKRIPAASLP